MDNYKTMTNLQLTIEANKLWNSIIFAMSNNVRVDRAEAMADLSALREVERELTLREEQ